MNAITARRVTDAGLQRVDQILTELIETVETARAVPMSASCVVPRERMLDLFDDLREVLPPEMTEARKLILQRDSVLEEARTQADHEGEQATQTTDAMLADARHQVQDLQDRAQAHARGLIEAAELQVRELLEAGRAEHAHLVSATGVHQAASEEAARLRSEAEHYSTRLRVESEAYAQHTLSDLLDVLQRAARTTEQGLQKMTTATEQESE
jgi:ElaB/YqjD/DUF883 family membrane-anchored ribosome-binding protein